MLRKIVITGLSFCIHFGAHAASRKTSDPALNPPAIQTEPGPKYSSARRLFQGVPTIERTRNGRLWAAWFASNADTAPDTHVVMVTSDDDGKTWSEPRLVIDPRGNVCAFDPCFWLDPDGMLWLFWAQSEGTWDGRGGVWCITSEDSQSNAPTWSAPRRLCDGVMINKPAVLRNGTWLLPVSVWAKGASRTTEPAHRHDPGADSGANVHATIDGCRTLERIGRVRVAQREYDEHHIIERRDGSLWMLLRVPYGIAECTSADGGRTWSEGQPSTIPNVNSHFCIRRLRSGGLLLITHEPPDGKSRSHLIARISKDDGHSWLGGLMLDERTGVSYPDIIESPKGVLRVIYDFQRHDSRQILLAQFSERDVIDGKAGRGARLRMLVNQADGANTTPHKSAK